MNRLLTKANRRISLGGAATLLIVVALFGQVLGFLRNRLVSANFSVHDPGASDAFFAAFQIPDFFFYTIAAGALGVAFIPFLSDKLETGDRKGAWDLASSMLNVLIIAMGVVAVVSFIFAPQFIRVLTPSLRGEHFDQAVLIMRLVSINPLLFSLSGILTSVQQTFGRFFFYAIAPLFYNLAIILSIYLFRDSIGIVGLGIGALVGGLAQLAVAWLGMFGLKFRWRPRISWQNQDFRTMLRHLPARSIDQGIDQVNSMVEINRASALNVAGSVSNYAYALTLMNVPVMLLGNSIAIAAFPRLTDRLSQGRPDLFRRDFLQILRTIIWLTMPVLVISYFCRAYLARLIYADVAREVALIFGYLVLAILFRIIYSMVSRYFYAYKDTKTPLLVSVFAITLNIVLAFNLARPEPFGYGISGLAMAQSIVAVSEVVVLVSIMLYRDRKLIDISFGNAILRIMSVTGFSLLAAFIMISFLPLKVTDRGFTTLGGKLAIISIVTLAVHTAISWVFELEEAKAVLHKAKKLILKPIRLE
jgi:putative peptidoglycan lipid II flippase